jgi:hypothetical protein
LISQELSAWIITHPPVCMKSPDTPATSLVNLTLIAPGGRIWSAGGDLFWIIKAPSGVLVITLWNPSKFDNKVSKLYNKYGMEF